MATKLTIENMMDIAKKKGGKCISDVYINNTTKLKFECENKHVWFSRPSDIKRNHWCPKCARQRMIGNTYRLGKIKNKELQKNGL
jgi:hypothetical protein